MTPTTKPLPPTDGTHPHAQPVHYARPNAYTHTASAWQEEFRLLLLDVAHSPALRREIDRGAPVEDSTFATRREFEDMMKAQEALHQSRKGAKKVVVQNTVPLEKPGSLPRKSRAREYVPTGNPKGRPRGTAIKATEAGYQPRPCPRCAVDFKPVNSVQVWCKACAHVATEERRNQKRKEARAKFVVTCARCGCEEERRGSTQKYCLPCSNKVIAEKKEAHNQARKKSLLSTNCQQCGEEFEAKTVRRRFCSKLCYWRWEHARERGRKQGGAQV